MFDNILEKELGKVGQKAGVLGGFLGSGLLGAIGGSMGGKHGAAWAASKLPTDEVHDELLIQHNLSECLVLILNSLSTMGTIIDSSKYTDYPTIAACCGSGFANMNPAVVCVEFIQTNESQTKLYISAYAKEGLIKQKTAIKAIKRLKSIISKYIFI